MKITHMDAWPVTMRLTEPYTIAYEPSARSPMYSCRVETSAGIVGYGCAAPDLEVTGETARVSWMPCRSVIMPSFKGSDPLRRVMLMERIRPRLKTQPSAMAMADMALFDILGKSAGLPLYKLLGGFRDRMRTSITIGILPVKETVAHALERVAQGFRALKIKGGTDVDADIERLVKVREAVGRTRIDLRFDANQGYSEADVLRSWRRCGRLAWNSSNSPPPGRRMACWDGSPGRLPCPSWPMKA
jgi:L-alanine-DL-glutamate epimerase-like enolase superfamily enzyme